jgi:hypothetical protein
MNYYLKPLNYHIWTSLESYLQKLKCWSPFSHDFSVHEYNDSRCLQTCIWERERERKHTRIKDASSTIPLPTALAIGIPLLYYIIPMTWIPSLPLYMNLVEMLEFLEVACNYPSLSSSRQQIFDTCRNGNNTTPW